MTLEEWMERNVTEEFDADDVTSQYLKIRRARARMSKAFDEDDAVMKAEQERLGALMLDFLNTHKIKSAPSKNGVFFKKLQVKASCSNWTAFYDWIKENDAFEFLHKRITTTEVDKYLEAHKEDEVSLPPGIAVIKDYIVEVRTGKGEE
jgi:hypothetical protein